MKEKEKKVQKRIFDLFDKKKTQNDEKTATQESEVAYKQNSWRNEENEDLDFCPTNNKKPKLKNNAHLQNSVTQETTGEKLKTSTAQPVENDSDYPENCELDKNETSLFQGVESKHQPNNKNKEENKTKNMCPICNNIIPTSSNAILNQHIDECLNIQFLNKQNNIT